MLHGPDEQVAAGGVLAPSRGVRLDIEGQGQPRTHHRDHTEVMSTTADLMFCVIHGMTKRASYPCIPCDSRAIQSQADQSVALQGLLALGLAEHRSQGLPHRLDIESLGEIGQRIIPEAAAHTELRPRGRTNQSLDSVEATLPKGLTNHQRPEHILGRNPRTKPTIAGIAKVGGQPIGPEGEPL